MYINLLAIVLSLYLQSYNHLCIYHTYLFICFQKVFLYNLGKSKKFNLRLFLFLNLGGILIKKGFAPLPPPTPLQLIYKTSKKVFKLSVQTDIHTSCYFSTVLILFCYSFILVTLRVSMLEISPTLWGSAGWPNTPDTRVMREPCQGGSGHWAVYYTSPQSFIIFFSNSLV